MNHFFLLIFILFYVAIFGFVGFKFYKGYMVAEGTVWQRLHTTFTSSVTLVWGYVQIVGSYVVDNIEKLATAVNLPDVATFVMNYVNPKAAGVAMFLFGLITVAARVRSLFSS